MHHDSLIKHNLMLNGLGGAVTLGLVTLAIVFVAVPMDERQAELQAQILDMENLLAEHHTVQNKHDRLQGEVDALATRWAELRQRIPPEAQVSEFLSLLTELAETHGLNVAAFNPGVSSPQLLFTEMDIDLQATGDYVSICGFLQGLHQMQRICDISKLDINAHAKVSDQYTVSLKLRIIYLYDDSADD